MSSCLYPQASMAPVYHYYGYPAYPMVVFPPPPAFNIPPPPFRPVPAPSQPKVQAQSLVPAEKINGKSRLPVFIKLHVKEMIRKNEEEKAKRIEEFMKSTSLKNMACRHFARTGRCSFGDGCFFSHQK